MELAFLGNFFFLLPVAQRWRELATATDSERLRYAESAWHMSDNKRLLTMHGREMKRAKVKAKSC